MTPQQITLSEFTYALEQDVREFREFIMKNPLIIDPNKPMSSDDWDREFYTYRTLREALMQRKEESHADAIV